MTTVSAVIRSINSVGLAIAFHLPILFGLVVFPGFALAAAEEEVVAIESAAATSSVAGNLQVSDVLQVVTALAGIIVLIVLLAVLAKRVSGVSGHANGQIRVVSGVSLTNKDRLLLVNAGGSYLLLGVSPGRISKLQELTDYEEPSRLTTDSDSAPPGFPALLSSFAGRFNS